MLVEKQMRPVLAAVTCLLALADPQTSVMYDRTILQTARETWNDAKSRGLLLFDADMMSHSVHPWGQHFHDGHRLRCKSRGALESEPSQRCAGMRNPRSGVKSDVGSLPRRNS